MMNEDDNNVFTDLQKNVIKTDPREICDKCGGVICQECKECHYCDKSSNALFYS